MDVTVSSSRDPVSRLLTCHHSVVNLLVGVEEKQVAQLLPLEAARPFPIKQISLVENGLSHGGSRSGLGPLRIHFPRPL